MIKDCMVLALLLFYLGVPVSVRGDERVWREPLTGMEFVWIPAGSFVMGQTELGAQELILELGVSRYQKYCAEEKPRHRVMIDGFWLGRYEVTNAQFRLFRPDHDSHDYKGISLNEDRQPVVEVSWDDAEAYARWLAVQCGRECRLPREAEWEYACRAGSETVRFWGNGINEACVYANIADLSAREVWPTWSVHGCRDGFAVTAPVGSFAPNRWGLYDMLGNVWEWCSDWFGKGYYEVGPQSNPQGPQHGAYRILRGACWDSAPRYVRSASRNMRSPGSCGYNLGFRLAITADAESHGMKALLEGSF